MSLLTSHDSSRYSFLPFSHHLKLPVNKLLSFSEHPPADFLLCQRFHDCLHLSYLEQSPLSFFPCPFPSQPRIHQSCWVSVCLSSPSIYTSSHSFNNSVPGTTPSAKDANKEGMVFPQSPHFITTGLVQASITSGLENDQTWVSLPSVFRSC